MDSADGSDERHASNGTSETEHLGLGMHKEESPELEYHLVRALTESLKITKDKCETSKGSATIRNLGNTCYASCTLQYCQAVPELQFELRRYLKGSRNPNVDQSLHELMNALHDAITRLGDSDKPFRPQKFVKILRQVYQDFQETEDGLYKQQDMAECLSRMIETLSVTLRREESGSVLDPVKAIFGIEMISRGEKVPTTIYQLNCAVNDQIDDLDQGLEKGLRLANSKISKLPPYLMIQFHRVIHEGKAGRAIKTFQKVRFPSKLDMHRHCSKVLKSEIQGKRKLSKVGEGTGTYALIAVVTHEGKTSDSGHYTTFVKEEDTWIHFDDEKKFTTTENDVLKLCGGCDGPMACMCLYKSVNILTPGDEKSLDKGDTDAEGKK